MRDKSVSKNRSVTSFGKKNLKIAKTKVKLQKILKSCMSY